MALSARVGLPPARCGGCAGLRAKRAPAAPLRRTRTAATADAPQPVNATPTAGAGKPTPIAGYVGGRPMTPNKKKAEKAAKSGAAPPKPTLPKVLLCPCCSGVAYTECCAPYHAGGVEPDAEATMRARYSAYVKGDDACAKYIVSSTHPRSPDMARKGEPGSQEAKLQLLTDTAATMNNMRFQSLDITRNERGATENEWFISFRATYEPANVARPKPTAWREPTASKFLIEKARFLKDAASGRWLYMSSLTISDGLGSHGATVMPAQQPPAAA